MLHYLRRVPLNLDAPLGHIWAGFLTPEALEPEPCPDCDGSGQSEPCQQLSKQWNGEAPFSPEDRGSKSFTHDHPLMRERAILNLKNRNATDTSEEAIDREAQWLCKRMNPRWRHHPNQDDVNALLESHRLRDLTHAWIEGEGWRPKEPRYVPTAEEVQRWTVLGAGPDLTAEAACARAECIRRGVSPDCPSCGGEGELWQSEEQKAEYQAFEGTPPPTGTGLQMWHTGAMDSPISPVFVTSEELAVWLTHNPPRPEQHHNTQYWMEAILTSGDPTEQDSHELDRQA